jgi:glucokinase
MHYLGIEIGGTKLQLGVGPGEGTIAGFWRGHVEPADGADGIRKQITTAVPELLAKSGLQRAQLRGVGIGFGGPVDDDTRRIIKSHQIEGWDDFPLADWISELVGLPAVLGNDADVGGLGEALFGAGKGFNPIFYITIGSGIGGGLVINGEIYRGSGRGAAEIGHMRQWLGAESDSHSVQIVEHLASGWALQEKARSLLASKADLPETRVARGSCLNSLHILEELTSRDVGEAAARGDEFAIHLLGSQQHWLAEAICNMIALLNPRRIVIGGGISLMGEKLLFEPLRRLVAERVFKPFAGCYEIVPAALGEAVVVHGALALAKRRLGS